MGYIRLAAILFCLVISQAQASRQEALIQDLRDLALEALQAPISFNDFSQQWRPHLDELVELTRTSDQASLAEGHLTFYMQKVASILMFNYNPQGVELVKTYGSPRVILRLAQCYVSGRDLFSPHNHPGSQLALLNQAFDLYHFVWRRTKTLQDRLRQELTASYPDGRPDLSFLYPKDRTKVIAAIEAPIIHQDLALALMENLVLMIDPFLPDELQNYACCARFIMSRSDLSLRLYREAQQRAGRDYNLALPDYHEWLGQATMYRPAERIKDET